MSEPTPSGEQVADEIYKTCRFPYDRKEMATIINAALVAEREKSQKLVEYAAKLDDWNDELQKELEEARDRLDRITSIHEGALAAERETEIALREQLSTERHNSSKLAQELEEARGVLAKALDELESPSVYEGEVQDGYSADFKVIESIRQALAKTGGKKL